METLSQILEIPAISGVLEAGLVILGTMVGSFLNVCIYRMPREQSLVWPRSACPRCGTPIAWFDNIPLWSFAILRGRCRRCREAISPRYPLVEALTALLFWLGYRAFGWSPSLLVALPFLSAMVVITFIDVDFQIIPNRITYPGVVIGLLFSTLWPSLHGRGLDISRLQGLSQSLIGGLFGYGILALIGLVSYLFYKKEAMGRGDFKLLAMLGTLVGWRGVLWVLFLACLVGSMVGILLILFGKKGRKDYIPFGPFLAAAGVLVFLTGDRLVRFLETHSFLADMG